MLKIQRSFHENACDIKKSKTRFFPTFCCTVECIKRDIDGISIVESSSLETVLPGSWQSVKGAKIAFFDSHRQYVSHKYISP